MDKTNYDIIPEYRFKMHIKYLIFSLGILSIMFSFFFQGYEFLSFLGLIIIIIGGLYTIFTTKRFLRINNEEIKYEEKSVLKDFGKSFTIRFEEVDELYFLKKQFLILGGRNPYADADTQTLYNENRIVFKMKNSKGKVIPRVGKKEEFQKAFKFIRERVEKSKTY